MKLSSLFVFGVVLVFLFTFPKPDQTAYAQRALRAVRVLQVNAQGGAA